MAKKKKPGRPKKSDAEKSKKASKSVEEQIAELKAKIIKLESAPSKDDVKKGIKILKGMTKDALADFIAKYDTSTQA